MRRTVPALCLAAILLLPVTAAAAPVPQNARTAAGEQSICSAAAPLKGPLTGHVIVIDPGHGLDPRNGTHTGDHGINGAWEDDNVLDIGCRLVRLLSAEGASVYITRGTYDPGPPPNKGLKARVAFAESRHAQVYISIHQNAGPPQKRGVKTYYFRSDSIVLAQDVQRAMVAGTPLRDAGIHVAPFYVIRNTTMPAVLVEGGFLSNRTEAALITTPAFHQQEAEALNAALLEYFGASAQGSLTPNAATAAVTTVPGQA